DDEDEEVFEPEVPDPDVLALLRFVTGDLRGQFSVRKTADVLHLWDVLAEQEELVYDLHIPLRDDLYLHELAERIGERELRVICDPEITAHPGTRRERNLPAELAAAGAKLAFLPRSAESVSSHRDWLANVGELVAYGLDRQTALRALTLEPAHAIGMGERLGSLEAGKRADLLIFDGDPFETTTKLQAVMLAGKLVHGELNQ
ncbi:MAG: amidohydrolase family protein, partial [Planctomycetota bacterium]